MASHKMTHLDMYHFHCKYAENSYKDYMSKRTQTSKYTQPEDLQDWHDQATLVALRSVSEVQVLTKELLNKVEEHLEETFRSYQTINLDKLTSRGPVLAIDFGSSNSCAALYRKKKVVIIVNSDGQKETPSYVAIDVDFETRPDVYVGEPAKKNSLDNPKNSIFGMKEMLTKRWKDISKLDKLPYEVVIDRDMVSVRVGRFYTVEELIGTIIKKLKADAEEYLGRSISCAIISVPVRFNAHQRALLKQACTMVGLNILQIVTEPTASLVGYDLLNPDNSQLWIVGVHEEFKGGDSFDKKMLKYCLKEFNTKHGIRISSKGTSEKDERRLKRLRMECERQKRSLSVAAEVTVNVSSFYMGNDLVVKFTRKLFETLNGDNFMELVEKVDEVIVNSGLSKNNIDNVILAGGSSSVHGVQEQLRGYFKRDIILGDIPPGEAIVHGLALLAEGKRKNPEIENVRFQEMDESPSRPRITSDVLFDPSTQTVVRGNPKRHTEPSHFKPSGNKKNYQ
ncbi:unnamed protein product [Allacma fusca]|uniref:Uncharacterized protein n=1 Tax=Allacma fusca TaxID=39272 RepID=A0A8J2JD58_9HEXA|nr:unnamed protein product [Allacma fusca]